MHLSSFSQYIIVFKLVQEGKSLKFLTFSMAETNK